MRIKRLPRQDANFMLALADHDLLQRIRTATGYTQTQAVIVAVECYQPQDDPQWPARGADRAPLRVVLPDRVDRLLRSLQAEYGKRGKKPSRQDIISDALRTYSVRE